MKKHNQISTRPGFTIIEVVLVLAIAGLIFLMVFLALPALQRNQRDTQRNDDIARLQTALMNYQTNNRGKIPDGTGFVEGHETKGEVDTGSKSWTKFYDNYLLVGEGTATDTFMDPDGEPYGLFIVDCEPEDSKCGDKAQRNETTFTAQSDGRAEDGAGHTILIVRKATCIGEESVPSTGSRNVAIVYKKEGGGTICLNN